MSCLGFHFRCLLYVFSPKLWLGSCNRLKHFILQCCWDWNEFRAALPHNFRRLPVTNKPFHSPRRSHLYSCHHCPSITAQVQALQQEAQNHRFFFFYLFFVRNYMVQVLNLEQGPSPPLKWVCHGWRRWMCSCVNEPPFPFRGWDLHPSLFSRTAHAVSCLLLFSPLISTESFHFFLQLHFCTPFLSVHP